ncbi:hypothetical protein EB061_13145, partial [bacterium]|nr:hypothetical protein [bacterium]
MPHPGQARLNGDRQKMPSFSSRRMNYPESWSGLAFLRAWGDVKGVNEESPKSIIFFESASLPQALQELREQYARTEGIMVLSARNSRECHARLQDAGRAIILFSISSKEDFAEILSALVRMQTEVRAGLVRALGFNFLKNDKVEPALRQKGC